MFLIENYFRVGFEGVEGKNLSSLCRGSYNIHEQQFHYDIKMQILFSVLVYIIHNISFL